MIASGSAQFSPAPDASRQLSSARRQRRIRTAAPKAPSSTVAMPAYQITQYSVSSEYSLVGSTRSPAIRCRCAT